MRTVFILNHSKSFVSPIMCKTAVWKLKKSICSDHWNCFFRSSSNNLYHFIWIWTTPDKICCIARLSETLLLVPENGNSYGHWQSVSYSQYKSYCYIKWMYYVTNYVTTFISSIHHEIDNTQPKHIRQSQSFYRNILFRLPPYHQRPRLRHENHF